VKTIEAWLENDVVDEVSAGMSVGITVEDEFFNKRGEIISHKEDTPLKGNLFNANLFWMGRNPLVQNKKYKLKVATVEVECEIFCINKVIDASTLQNIEYAKEVKQNDVAEVTIKTKQIIPFDEFRNLSNTGRFVIVDDLDVSGGGIITGIEETLTNREIVTKSTNIVPRKRLVSKKEREEKLNQKGKVIWLTGLPGCGKNEIAIKLEKKLFDLGKKVYYLDSSILRFGLSSDLAFTKEDAREQTRRIAEVAHLFADSGTVTIVTSVSRFKEDREYAKSIIGKENFLEILVDATKEVCKKRNSAGLYEDSDMDLNYERSEDLVGSFYIDDPEFNAEKKAENILELLQL